MPPEYLSLYPQCLSYLSSNNLPLAADGVYCRNVQVKMHRTTNHQRQLPNFSFKINCINNKTIIRSILFPFPDTLMKYCDKGNLRRKGSFQLTVTVAGAQGSQSQKRRKKQMMTVFQCSVYTILYSSRSTAQGTVKMHLPTSINIIMTILHRRSKRLALIQANFHCVYGSQK